MKFNKYALIVRAVEEGVQRGWHRAFKHTEQPGDDTIVNTITDEVMSSLGEIIWWETPE